MRLFGLYTALYRLLCLIFCLQSISSAVVAAENVQSNASVIIAFPGEDINSGASKIVCSINLLQTKPKTHVKEIFLNAAASEDLDTIFDLLSLTPTGMDLKERFQRKINSGELKIEKMPEEMLNRSKVQFGIGASGAKMAYVHRLRTIFTRQNLTTGEVLLSLVHEFTHAKDLLGSDGDLTKSQELDLEVSAFAAQDKFFEELITAVPCYKQMFPEFPRYYNRIQIKELYPHLN